MKTETRKLAYILFERDAFLGYSTDESVARSVADARSATGKGPMQLFIFSCDEPPVYKTEAKRKEKQP